MTRQQRIVEAGIPWPQRLKGVLDGAPENVLLTAAQDDLYRRWRRTVDPEDAGLFPLRLDRDGLDVASARRIIAGPAAADPAPRWVAELDALRAAVGGVGLPDELSDVPFGHLLAPMVKDAWLRLEDRLEPAVLAPISDQARASLRRDLAERLIEVCGRAWYAEFTSDRPQGTTVQLRLGAPPSGRDDRYRQWCQRQCDDQLADVLGRYPVLGRLMATVSQQWAISTAAMIDRLADHRAQLASQLAVPVDAAVEQITTGLSDRHRSGQTVAILRFATPTGPISVVYKPKDLRIDRQLQRVCAAVNIHFGDEALHRISVVTGSGDYGFTSFVERRLPPESDLGTFYRSAGRMVGVLYLLGGTDAHFENLIVSGTSLALLDAETLFDTTWAGRRDDSDFVTSFADSVLATGMLPGWHLAGSEQAVYDPSALGAEHPATTAGSHSEWLHVNTDDMVRQAGTPADISALSLPVPAGRPNPVADYVEHLIAGFQEVHRACRDSPLRERLVTEVRAFHSLPRRLVLRGTRVYAVVQQQALAPGALTSGQHRGVALEPLTRSSLIGPGSPPQWRVLHAEFTDMENVDVPYFEHTLGTSDARGTLGPIDGLIVGDGLRSAIERIGRIDEDDLVWQSRLIRGSVRSRSARVDALAPTAPTIVGESGADPHHTTRPDTVAAALLDRITESTVTGPDGVPGWLTLYLMPDGQHTRLGMTSDSWYDGRTGIAAVQRQAVELGVRRRDATDGAVTDALATLLANDSYARFRRLRTIGLGFSGVGGLIRALLTAPASAVTRADWDRLLSGFPTGLIDRDRVFDLMGGVAGLIPPLARLVERGHDAARPLLAAAADHLAAQQNDSGAWPTMMAERPLTGLAHGASGGSLALFEAGVALGRAELVDAAARALRYEDDLFDPDAGNWPDLRTGSRHQQSGDRFMVAWCHGAPGIGLARIRALQLAPAHPDADRWRRDLDAAMHTTAHAPDSGTDHLCCGVSGRAAVLRIAGRTQGRPDWLAAADLLTSLAVARWRRDGHFSLPLDAPATDDTISPGLMTGLAGIAAHLMTIADDTDLTAYLL